MKIGVQFYTIREAASTLEGFSDALARVADMGYTTVQISGTCGYEPEWLAGELKKNGLSCVLTHTSPDRIRDDTAKVAAEHKIFGCNYVGVGCMPGLVSPENTEKYIKEFVPAAKTLKVPTGPQPTLPPPGRLFRENLKNIPKHLKALFVLLPSIAKCWIRF